ncbi:MAG: GMC oxidoreductase [Dendronalium sp. ChiSLP03b]
MTTTTALADQPIQAIVIGSGFGGAVAALRLGQAGIRTLVLERGRRWPITPAQDTFATYDQPDGRSAWFRTTTPVYNPRPIDKYAGILDLIIGNGINILNGAGVGGGSLVYAASTYQPTKRLFERVFPKSVKYHELDRIYYPRVRSILKPSPVPQDILNTSYYLSSRVFLEQAARAGLPTRLLDINVDWDIVRQEINGTRRPSTIIGESWYGINSGAKNSLDRNYLAQAEATGKVEILPLHVVQSISELGHKRGYRVVCDQIDEFGQVLARHSFICRHLFLAAGSLGTTKLLLKAKATGELRRLSEDVGKYWGTNGNTVAVRAGLIPTNPTQGGPSTVAVEHFNNPIAPTVLVYAPFYGLPQGTLGSLGLNISQPDGQITYNSSTENIDVNWPITSASNQTNLQAATFTYNLIDTANTTPQRKPTTRIRHGSIPASRLLDPDKLQSNLVGEVSGASTVAPLGGAVIEKVCDSYGRVFGHSGLYIVDGSLIPGSAACATPSLTIAALAERSMDRILNDIRIW